MIPIAITRMATRTALGSNLALTIEALRIGTVGFRPPNHLEQSPRHSPDLCANTVATTGEVPDSQACGGDARAELLLRATIEDLLTPANRASIAANPNRWGIVLGTTLAGMRHAGSGLRAEQLAGVNGPSDCDDRYTRTVASSVMHQAISGLGLSGPTITVSCACASALSAISQACALLEAGEIDAAIAGGYDAIAEFSYAGFAALQLIDPEAVHPFAKTRAGMKLGEGVALFVLRRFADLRESEDDPIIALIEATAESSDAHHLTQPHPTGSGAATALLGVLDETRLPEMLIAHATGTPANDAAEYEACRAVFGQRINRVPVVALKSRFGHSLGAAGALELIATLGCADAGFTPTTAGPEQDLVAFPDLHLVRGDARNVAPSELVALSAGFGGANAAIRVVRGAAIARAIHSCVPASAARPTFDVCITGVGAVSPAGRGIDALIARTHDSNPWNELEELTLAPLLDRAKTRRLALLPRIMIAAMRDLVEQAGLSADDLAHTPLIAANWCGTPEFTIRYYRDLISSGIDLANPLLFAECVPNVGSAHCSIAYGIRAASFTVIGRRTAAIEALALARAKIATGVWPRVIVVAAEEAHPVMGRLLSRCAGEPVELRSSGVAVLLEQDGNPGTSTHRKSRGEALRLESCLGQTATRSTQCEVTTQLDFGANCFTTTSPFDQVTREFDSSATRLPVPELGATTALATLFTANARRASSRESFSIVTSDPHGARWSMSLR